MTDVTVLFLDGTFSSTAIGPMEVFRHSGSLWNVLTGKRADPGFRVTTASADGRAVHCDGEIRIQPSAALADVRKTDLIFIPSSGISLDDVVERNAAVVPWLRRWRQTGYAHRQRMLRCGAGRSHRHARRQARHHALGAG